MHRKQGKCLSRHLGLVCARFVGSGEDCQDFRQKVGLHLSFHDTARVATVASTSSSSSSSSGSSDDRDAQIAALKNQLESMQKALSGFV